jgi:hypothetical protein
VLGKISAGAIRGLSGFGFYDLVQQLDWMTSKHCLAVRRGAHVASNMGERTNKPRRATQQRRRRIDDDEHYAHM